MKKIVLLLLLLLTLTIQGFAQNIQLDVDGDNLFYNEPGCSDCNGNPDPRWRVRFVINGGNFDWNNDRDEVCGWANQSNFGVHSPTSMGYSATVSTQMDGFESDGFTCGGDDNGCGGYGTMATRTASASPPCQWNFFYDSRGCGSGTYGLDWSFYWSYLFSPVISGETNTNQVRCNGVAPAVLSATVNTDGNGRSLARWFRWQISNTPTGPWVDVTGANGSNTATTLSFTPGQISGTRYYRLQTTSNCGYDFGSYTATSAVYTVTYAFVSTGAYSNVSGYTYAAGDAAPAIQSSICGTTVLPAQTINFPLLLGANAGAAVNYTSLAWTASAGSPTTGSGTSLTWTAPTASGTYNINVTYNYAGCSSPATVTCAVTVGSPTCNFAYVAAGGSDVPTGGGPSNPYATIAYAITQLGTRTHIRLAGSTTESNVVNIPAGVTIEGGYTNTSGLWVKNNNTPSTITCNGFESVSGVCHRVGFKATTSNWSLIDLNITTSAVSGTDGSNRGCSNYGLWLNGASNYNVIRCNITSGAASNGANGVAGSNGANGGNGGGGLTDNCNDDDFLDGGGGGGGGVNAWGGNGGAGGRGGNAAAQSNRSRGCNGSAGATVGSAAGGAGGTSPGTPCQNNYAGGNSDGDFTNDNAGAGNTGVPNHTAGVRAGVTHTYGIYYTPSGQGAVGGHGSGGGGGSGGGSSGGESCFFCNNNYGNSGGGGGGGGGGGQAGTGGYGGGSSFGVYRNTSSTGANFANVTLAAGTLGNGGNGANGGNGGLRGEGGGGNGNCSGDRRTSRGGAPGRAGGSGGRGQDAANGVSATFVSDGTITAFTNSAAANSPVMTVPYNNTSFCQNSQVTITKASGTWVLPSGLSLVNLQNNTTTGQALADNNIVVTTTNTVASPTGFNFTSPATVGSFLIQSPTTRGVPAITVNASTTASICVGGSVTLAQTVTNGGTILNHDWRIFSNGGDARSPLAGLTSSLANPTISVSALAAGTYWVYYSQLEQCCGWSTPVYQSFTIVADPVAPTLNVATPASGTDVCVGGTVSATITAGSGGVGCTDDYRVSTDGGSTWAAYTSGASIVPTATGTIIVQGRRANSCGNGCDGTAVSYQQLATWTVLADPTSETAVTATTICSGSSADVTASAIGGNGTISSVTFERATASITGPWTTVQTSSSATYSLPTSLAAGTYYYRATVTQTVTGCAAAADASPVTVVVLPTPTVGISGTTTVCQNASSPNITFTNSLANPITVSYTLNGVAQADINVAASSTATVAAITTSPGTFTYLVTNVKYQSAPTCDANPAVSAVVTVTPSTVAPTFTAGATTICANGTDTYTATTTQGTVTYSIIGGTGAAINSTTGALTSAGTADFTVRATSTNGVCSSLFTDRAVTVTPATVAPTFTAGATTICANGTDTYTATTTQGTVTYSIIGGTGAAINSTTGVLTSAGTANFTVRATSTNGVCSSLFTDRAVTVTPATVAPTFTAGATTICANGTGTYTATTTQGTVTYSIIGGTGAAINSTTGALTSAGTADFTVRATSTNGVCSSLFTDRAVTVTPATVAPTFTAGATTICANGTDTYTATTTQGTVTYSIIGGTGAAINSTTGALTSAGTANFTVRATSTNGVCSSLFTDRVVTVRPIPTASVTVTGTNPVCQTGSSTVRFSGLNGTTITYNINGGSNTTTNITSGGFVDVGTGALSVTSTYNIVDAFYTDNSPGCTATPSGSAAVTVVTGPIQRTVTAPTTVCSGSSATVTLQSSESGTVYQLYSTTDNVNVGSTQTGNGGNLSFSTGALFTDNTYKIIASRNPCAALDMNNGDDVSVYVVTNGSWKGSVSDNWFDGGNWCLGGGIPTSSTDITIPTGSITDFDPVIASNGAVSRTININSGGIMTISTNRNLDVWGTWNNSGNVNFNVSTVTFKGTGNVNLTGGIPQAFYNLRVDKGTTSTPIVDIQDNTTVYGSLIPTNGRFQVSADLFIDNSLAVTTIASTAGIDVQGGNFRAAGLNITNNGLYNISSGTDSLNTLTNGSGSTYTHAGGISELTGNVTNTGATVTTAGGLINVAGNWSNASSSTVTYSGATIAIVGDYSSSASTVNANSATVSIGGRYTNSSSSTLSLGGAIVSVGGNYVSTGSSINQTGGAMTLNTTGASYNSNAILDIDASSNLNISSGTIYLQRANAGTGNDLVIAAGGTKTITGGTFQFGNASTPASQVFKVNNNAVDFNNFNVDNSSSNMPTVRLLANAATRSAGVLTVNGVLDLNGYTFNVKNGATTGIVAAGYVISETSGGTSKLAWNIGNNTGTYVYPFGTAAGESIPFTFDVTTAGAQSGAGNVTLSTYPTGDDNTPWVSGVQHMNFDQGPGSGTDATLDRWWIIDANNYTTRPRSNMTFKYASADLSGNSSILEDNLKAQRWNATGGPDSLGGWDLPTEYGIVSTANAADNTVTATGVSRYSPWVLHDGESSGNSPLPIELVDFKASCTNDVVTINWTTATEINNDYFTVQRSTDLVTYDNVAVVQGAGNSNTYRNYSAKDQYPLSGTSYYRLMQTDFNGDFEVFSPEAVACVTKDNDVISVFPNPAQDRLNVSMYLSSSDRGSIMIYNHYGQLVESMFVEPKAGVNTYNFDLGNLAQGQYFISFSMEAKVLPTQKVVITR